jgi:hypothetical protein
MAKDSRRGDFLAECLLAICVGALAGVLWACQDRIKALFSRPTPVVSPARTQQPDLPPWNATEYS